MKLKFLSICLLLSTFSMWASLEQFQKAMRDEPGDFRIHFKESQFKLTMKEVAGILRPLVDITAKAIQAANLLCPEALFGLNNGGTVKLFDLSIAQTPELAALFLFANLSRIDHNKHKMVDLATKLPRLLSHTVCHRARRVEFVANLNLNIPKEWKDLKRIVKAEQWQSLNRIVRYMNDSATKHNRAWYGLMTDGVNQLTAYQLENLLPLLCLAKVHLLPIEIHLDKIIEYAFGEISSDPESKDMAKEINVHLKEIQGTLNLVVVFLVMLFNLLYSLFGIQWVGLLISFGAVINFVNYLREEYQESGSISDLRFIEGEFRITILTVALCVAMRAWASDRLKTSSIMIIVILTIALYNKSRGFSVYLYNLRKKALKLSKQQ